MNYLVFLSLRTVVIKFSRSNFLNNENSSLNNSLFFFVPLTERNYCFAFNLLTVTLSAYCYFVISYFLFCTSVLILIDKLTDLYSLCMLESQQWGPLTLMVLIAFYLFLYYSSDDFTTTII